MSNSHISPQEYQAQLASNKMKTYQSLDQEMHILYKRDTDDDCAEVVRIARELISHADPPLYFRCRALLILSCSREPGYLGCAEEAVRIAELGMSDIENPGEIETKLLNDCKAELEDAKTDAKAEEAEALAGEDAEADDSEGEVVWDANWEETKGEEDAGAASQSTEVKEK